MDVRFWGTRGSIPTPLTPQQVRAKIEAAVQRITPRDLESPDSRERFVASLPPFLFGTVGGNTSCVEVRDSAGNLCLLDAGTGIREYAKHGVPAQDNTYHILLWISSLHLSSQTGYEENMHYQGTETKYS